MYKLISKKYCSENIIYIGYGIAACNKLSVSPIHLADIVADFLERV